MSTKRALISVTDKSHIVTFARDLVEAGYEIISTGGTAKHLMEKGVACTLIETVTGFPEIMKGRLKTLHPKVFGGILADRDDNDNMDEADEHDIRMIDVVVVNLYQFDENPSIETIDVGGPSLIRAAAKNYRHVTVVVNPKDYHWVAKMLCSHPRPGDQDKSMRLERLELAAIAFRYTSAYDDLIATHFCKANNKREDVASGAKH